MARATTGLSQFRDRAGSQWPLPLESTLPLLPALLPTDGQALVKFTSAFNLWAEIIQAEISFASVSTAGETCHLLTTAEQMCIPGQ